MGGLALVVAGCGGDTRSADGTVTSGGGDDTSTTTTTGPGSASGLDSSGMGSDDGAPRFDVAPPLDGGMIGDPDPSCSKDLKSIVDGNTGGLLATCPPDQGCLDGVCVAACDAARGAQGSLGCDYFVPTSPFRGNGTPAISNGPCHALMVSNPWDQPAQLTLDFGGQSFDVATHGRIPSGITDQTVYDPIPATGLPPGEVAVVFLAHRPGVSNLVSLECPFEPAVLADTAVAGDGQGQAFEVHSDTPVQVYDIIPYGGAFTALPSASLLYPNSGVGTNYMVTSTPSPPVGSTWLLLTATEDNTEITINPVGGFLPGLTTITLDAGQTQQWHTPADPSGTVIQSTLPVGTYVGNTNLNVDTQDPEEISGTDAAHQQMAPISALGWEYVGAATFSRLAFPLQESARYRVMATVDGTTLTWDPAPVGAPAVLNAGEVAEFESRDVFVVASQGDTHPFVLTQYMSGAINPSIGCGNSTELCPLGDDEWIVVIPPAQFLNRYSFFVDPTYGTSGLVLTRVRGDATFHDVDLDCLGTLTDWTPVGGSGRFEVARVELWRSSTNMTDPMCETSRHDAVSSFDFGITVWGQDRFASYGYPAGGNAAAITPVVIPPAG